jgi:hypothetical protein
LQHPVEKQPKIHLDGVEFTLKYGNGMRKVVANLGTTLVNFGRCKMVVRHRLTAAIGNLHDLGDA